MTDTNFGPIEGLVGRTFCVVLEKPFVIVSVVGRKATIGYDDGEVEIGVGRLAVYLQDAEEVRQ
jgi:hypothetical protein